MSNYYYSLFYIQPLPLVLGTTLQSAQWHCNLAKSTMGFRRQRLEAQLALNWPIPRERMSIKIVSSPSITRGPRKLNFSGILLSLNRYGNSYSNHYLPLR